MSTHDQNREALAGIVKKAEQKFGGPRLAEFANDPPIRKHYAVAEAILREFDVTAHTEDMGAAANCHLCVGAGGYENHGGGWVLCSCQRAEPQGEPSDAQAAVQRLKNAGVGAFMILAAVTKVYEMEAKNHG